MTDRTKTGEATPTLPIVLEGHWTSPDGHNLAVEYASKDRPDLCHGEMSDFAIANAVFMASRDDLALIHYQTAAKERIRWLSVKLAQANAALQRVQQS